VDGRLCSLGGGTGELALDKRSVGDLFTSLFLVGGRELGCGEAVAAREWEREEVEDIVLPRLEKEVAEEKVSEMRRSHFLDVEVLRSAEVMQVDVGVSWAKLDTFGFAHVCSRRDSLFNGGVVELKATGRFGAP
jgi:hypothetical protein